MEEERPVVGKFKEKQPSLTGWSSSGLIRLQLSVRQAESRGRVEIVPVLVARSSGVGHVWPLAGVMLWLVSWLVLHLTAPRLSFIVELIVISTAVGLSWYLAKSASLQRWLTADQDEREAVAAGAQLEFYRHRVEVPTRRPLLLLFISMMERRLVLLGDERLNAIWPQAQQREMVIALSEALAASKPEEELSKLIERLGEKLAVQSEQPVLQEQTRSDGSGHGGDLAASFEDCVWIGERPGLTQPWEKVASDAER